MRVGILGAGNISATHASAAMSIPGVEIAAVYGANRGKAAVLASRFGAAVYDDLTAFLDHRPMDFVLIGSPSGVHAAQAIAAVQRGLPALVEKPLDVSLERIDDLIRDAVSRARALEPRRRTGPCATK